MSEISELRVVSLIASATEMVCRLGLENALVGRSHECDHPESIRSLPMCTRPKFDVEGSSAEINRRVKETLESSLSVYDVDAGLLKRLQPDVIVTQTQCQVCAVSEHDVMLALTDWPRPPRIVSLSPNSLSDVWLDIQRVADALGVQRRGEELIVELQARIDNIAALAKLARNRPRVACIEWIEPLMAAGHWMPELVTLAGGVDVFGIPGQHAPPLTWDQFRHADPDIIIVMPCGFDITRTVADMHLMEKRPEWHQLDAVQNGNVFVADGNQFFNRPGPRIVESLEILAEIIHPGRFDFGQKNIGWRHWPT